jgi:hypothetical protein
MRSLLLLLAPLLGVLLLAACSTPCEDLAAKICSCEADRTAQDACKRRAAQVKGTESISDAEQNLCSDKLAGCNCNALNTAAGKFACGLAPDGG